MAQKVTASSGPKVAAKSARRWLPVAVVGVALAGGALAWYAQKRPAATVAVQIPAVPDVSKRPAELGRILNEALARVDRESDSVASVAELAGIYHVNGFSAEAEACWKVLQARQPQEARWSYYLSDLSRMRADEAGLRAGLEQTVRLAPNYAPAWLELGDLEFKTGRLERATQAYQERVRLIPADPYALLGLARIALQQDRKAEGRALIEDLVKRVPQFPSGHNIYAEILTQEGDQAEAGNQRWLGTVAGRFRAAPDPWKEELRQWCCDIDQLIVWGAIDFQTHQGDQGKAYFEKAIRLEPKNPQGYENLGMYYLDAGNAAKAAEVLEQGSTLSGVSELLFSSLGDAYLALREPGKALQMADKAMTVIPGSSLLQNVRGLAFAASNRPEEAMAAYRAAAAASAGAAEPVANMGLLLLQQGRKDEAKEAFKQALELQPAYVKAARPLAYLEMESGDLQEAGKLVLGYFQQFPGLPEARNMVSRYFLTIALHAAQQQNNAVVERACRQGLALVPESAELMGFLGVNYLQQGRQDDALKVLEPSYRLRPGDPRVALVLADLYIRLGRAAEARPIAESTLQEARRRNDAGVAGRATQLLDRIH